MSKYRNTIYYDFKSRFLVIFSFNYQHRLVLKIPFPDHIFPKISKFCTENLLSPSVVSWTIYLIMKLNLLLATCLEMMMSMIIEINCNKCPGICKQFKNFSETLYINLLNIVKLVHNKHRRFLKKGLQKASVLLDSMSLQTAQIIIGFPQIKLR